MQRKTYAIIDGNQIKENVKEIIKNYKNYKYYFGVVKNNAYHHGMKCVLDMIDGGINYFAVSSLEEALCVRKYTDYPVLCLEPISLEFIDDIINANITITVESLSYLKKLAKLDLFGEVKIHLAVDSGMNRLGFQSEQEFNEAVSIINGTKFLSLEGLYSHFATSGIMDPHWDMQVDKFLEITKSVKYDEIPIVHLGRSQTLVHHEKLDFCNGIRLGIIMYGFSQSHRDGTSIKARLRTIKRQMFQKKYNCSKTTLENNLTLKPAMSLFTEVMSSRKVSKGDVVGYNTYKVKEDGYILTLPIGYADGVDTRFQKVAIKDELFLIVSDCMDMIMVFSKKDFPCGTLVEIFGDVIPVSFVCNRLGINAYHLYNNISNRVIRVHKNGNEQEEIYY